MKASEVVTRFIEQVNAQSTNGICRMMTEDHRFIDGLGSVTQGREQMRKGWAGYFSMVPDYWISSEEMIERDGVVQSSAQPVAHTARMESCWRRIDGRFRPRGEPRSGKTW